MQFFCGYKKCKNQILSDENEDSTFSLFFFFCLFPMLDFKIIQAETLHHMKELVVFYDC